MKVLTQLDSLDNVIDGDTRKLLTKTASGGSGNVVSGVSISGDTITYTKGVSALTADSTLNAGKLDGDIADGVTAVTQVNGDNSTKIATTAYVDNALSAQPEPMVFKGTVGTGGTITTLPTDGSANVGETYKVITNGTYAGQAAKVGDTFVCERKVSAMEELFDYGYQVTNQYDASGNEQNTSRYTLEDNVISISRDKTTYGRYFLNKTNLAAGTYTFIFVPTLSGTEKKISYCVKDLDNQVEIVEQTLTIVNDEEITKQFTLSVSRTVSIELQPLSSSGGTLTLSDISLTLPNGTNTWAYIPSGDEPSGTVTSIKINATGPIAIDNNAAITTSGERTISHANSGVTAGTYKSVTVNATGHVTAGSNPTTISGYGITDAKINNGVITLGSNTITPLTAHQNAFSNVKVGSTTVAADSAGDTLELAAGSNVTLTPDATNDKVTIAATDTTYTFATGDSDGQIKVTPSGGSAQNISVKGLKDLAYKKSELMTTNSFAPSDMTGLYISKIDNAFYALDKRFSTSWTKTTTGGVVTTGTSGMNTLFDGDYEGGFTISNGDTCKFLLEFGEIGSSGVFPGYPYGNIFVSFYYIDKPASISARVYCNYASQGIGWHDLTVTDVSTGTGNICYKIRNTFYNINQIEITVVGDTTNADHITRVTEIEMHLDRPYSLRNPFLSKYGDETLYYNLDLAKGSLKIQNGYLYGDVGSSTNHAIKLGHVSDDKMNFYEYGGLFNFYKSQGGANTLLGKITVNGWEGNVVGDVNGLAAKATGDKNGNDITTTYYLASNPNGYTSNTGTITGITMNGASKGTSGVVDLGTVITSHQSIKTINNNTITGTGNVSVGTITGVSVNGTSVATSGVANITSLPASILTGTVPAGCYTDTKNTAGSTDTSSKIFLVGATTQAANPQTYSDNEIFATNGVLSTKSVQVGGALATMQYNSTDECVEFVFA